MDSTFKITIIISSFFIFASCGQKDGIAPTVSCNPCSLFVTAVSVAANFGSTDNADDICASDANHPGDGIYKALTVFHDERTACSSANCEGESEKAKGWVLAPYTTYQRPDGTTIGETDSRGIFSSSLVNSLSSSAGYAWTGFISLGGSNNLFYTCNNWALASNTNPYQGKVVDLQSIHPNSWGPPINCDQLAKLVCAEQ